MRMPLQVCRDFRHGRPQPGVFSLEGGAGVGVDGCDVDWILAQLTEESAHDADIVSGQFRGLVFPSDALVAVAGTDERRHSANREPRLANRRLPSNAAWLTDD
jgi:hypothetical protein